MTTWMNFLPSSVKLSSKSQATAVSIVSARPPRFKFVATNARRLSVPLVTGAMNFKQITRYVSVIVVMPFIVDSATRWISVMIAEKWFAQVARPCLVASFAAAVYARIAQRPADGESYCCLER